MFQTAVSNFFIVADKNHHFNFLKVKSELQIKSLLKHELIIIYFLTATGAGVSKTTVWRHKKRKFKEERKAAAKAEGLPTPPKKRMVYTCKKCQQPQTKETGHSQYFGQTYCPDEPGQIPKEEWLAKKAADRKAKKASTG